MSMYEPYISLFASPNVTLTLLEGPNSNLFVSDQSGTCKAALLLATVVHMPSAFMVDGVPGITGLGCQ